MRAIVTQSLPYCLHVNKTTHFKNLFLMIYSTKHPLILVSLYFSSLVYMGITVHIVWW